jgi:rhamnose utilization protein RhaD (predicted bifunctional aldolase and dehydrogenase)
MSTTTGSDLTRRTGLEELVSLSRSLGEPARGLAILAEGNTSHRLPDGLLAVKATGRSLRDAAPADFVLVDPEPLSRLVDDPDAGDDAVAALFDQVQHEQGARPSVEALLHVVCVLDTDATWVAHTHPESVNALLCSDRAELLAERPLFPDQVVVVGRRALLVPYLDPGVVLARRVRAMLVEHTARWGPPRAVYLRNHGMVALGTTAVQTLQVTEMAAKTSRVLAAALSLGDVVAMTEAEVARIDSRDDEQVRRAALAASRLPYPDGTSPIGRRSR